MSNLWYVKSALKDARRRDLHLASARRWKARDPELHRETIRILVFAARVTNHVIVHYLREARKLSDSPSSVPRSPVLTPSSRRAEPSAAFEVLESI
jgi:hypothetical protein